MIYKTWYPKDAHTLTEVIVQCVFDLLCVDGLKQASYEQVLRLC